MTEKAMLKLKEDAEKIRDRAVVLAMEQYERDIASIDGVWKLLQFKQRVKENGHIATAAQINTGVSEVNAPPAAAPTLRIDVEGLVDIQLAAIAKEKPRAVFSARYVERRIREAHPNINGELTRRAIGKILMRRVKDEVIKEKEKGSGRRPTFYAFPATP